MESRARKSFGERPKMLCVCVGGGGGGGGRRFIKKRESSAIMRPTTACFWVYELSVT